MQTTLQYLNTLQWGNRLVGAHFQFKLRLNEQFAKEFVLPSVKKYPEVRVYITKAGKYIIGGVVHQNCPLKAEIERLTDHINKKSYPKAN